jgi:hypothetical protein
VPTRLESICQALAFCLPWLTAIAKASPSPTFAGDIALIRSFGLLPVGLEGLVSAALSSAFGLLPLGGKVLRAEFASALGLGLASLLAYRLARRLLLACEGDGWLVGPLGLMAALGATLGPNWVLEGTAPGGHALGAALALAALVVSVESDTPSLRRSLAVGVLVAATALESRLAGLGLVLALLTRVPFFSVLPSRRDAYAFLFGAGAVLLLPLSLWVSLLSSPAPQAGVALGLLGHGWSLAAAPVEQSVALGAWLSEMGLLGLVLSVAGGGVCLVQPRLRRLVLPLLVFLAVDLTFDVIDLAPTRHDPLSAVRLLALAGLGAMGAVALRVVTAWLLRARIAFARPASVLLVVYGFTLVLVSAEDSARAAETRAQSSAEAWTDAALASLPAKSAVLVRSEAIYFRLLASQVLRDSRPDVLLVPLELLERGGVRAELLAREQGLVPLVREMLLSGRPSEFALSALADTRPTYVELDPSWNARLNSHLVPQLFFTAFAAQPLARSDRQKESTRSARAFSQLVSQVSQASDGDPATRSVLADELAQRALVLAALGDREPASHAVADLLRLDSRSEVARSLRQRLDKGKGRVDVSGLYAAR